jgi:hypothetical protein
MLKLVKGYFDEIFKSVKRLKAWGASKKTRHFKNGNQRRMI